MDSYRRARPCGHATGFPRTARVDAFPIGEIDGDTAAWAVSLCRGSGRAAAPATDNARADDDERAGWLERADPAKRDPWCVLVPRLGTLCGRRWRARHRREQSRCKARDRQ